MFNSERWDHFKKTFGPGIMFAGTCVGGSHLVQSTRAGADYGFSLLIIILLANLFKYPFFEFASRYTNATGESIYEGYRKLGKWTLYLNLIITFVSMFIITAAILFITGGLLNNLLGGNPAYINYWIGALAIVTFILLTYGKYSILDTALKIIGAVLVISLMVAVGAVLVKGPAPQAANFQETSPYTIIGLPFIIALMGWMPMGVDMSAWGSLWTQERIKETGYHPTLQETLLDFNIGYIITVILAIFFLILGAFVMHGTGVQISDNSTAFSDQLVSMFSAAIGSWSYIIIGIAAFSTMFGTTLTLVDGYTRSMDRILSLLKKNPSKDVDRFNYWLWMILLLGIGFLIIEFGTTFKNAEGKALLNFKKLIDFATTLSFIIAPLFGYLNLKIVISKDFPVTHRPSNSLIVLSYLGIGFLSICTILYVYTIL